MKINTFRNKGFWFLDGLKGKRIKKHVEEIHQIQEYPTSINTIQLRQKSISNLIEHVKSTTLFYSKYQACTRLEEFPVINKALIQDNFEDFKSSTFRDRKNRKVATSGSTGLSFFLYQNKNKRNRNYADSIYFYLKSGFNLGDRIYKLIVWHNNNRKGKLEAWFLNMSQIDVSDFNDDRIESLLKQLQSDKEKNKVILCYASALELIAKYLEKHNVFIHDHGLNSMVAISEYLNTYTKNTLQKHLGIPILSRYSNEELGMIAQQTIEEPDAFTINHASYYVEILAMDSDEPAKPGEYGRIVVTDLFNYSMPLLRYDTGDIACYQLDDNGVMMLNKIEGRRMDVIYNTRGSIISSFITHAIFNKYYGNLIQYQFIQQDRKAYELKLNVDGGVFNFESELIDEVKRQFGNDAEVNISYVDEIPTLASGKRRKVVNNYHRA